MGDSEICKDDEQCIEHFISSKRSIQECVPTEQVWVISDSDDKAKVEASAMPLPAILASLAPLLRPTATLRWEHPVMRENAFAPGDVRCRQSARRWVGTEFL